MSFFEIIVLGFLFASTFFYVIFGGADFGAGIMELFSSAKNRGLTKQVTYRVLGPVWEANHVWLIVVMVILWIAYPVYFNIIVVQLHIPLTLVLFGIIARGTAFIYRHYDAIRDEQSQKVYNHIFQISSLLTPLMIGVVGGSLVGGQLNHPDKVLELDFYAAFIQPWFNLTSFSTGIFTICIFYFISTAFLIGDTSESDRPIFIKRALRAFFIMVLAGLVVFISDGAKGNNTIGGYFSDPVVLVMLGISGLLLIPLWKKLREGAKWSVRMLAVLEIFMVLGAWGMHTFPELIVLKEGHIGIMEGVANDKVFTWLGIALLIGSLFILPGLYHLYRMFGHFDMENPKAEVKS